MAIPQHERHVTVLMIEDDDVQVMAVRRAFRKQKIANPIVVARDGIEALEVLRGTAQTPPLPRPFMVLLDLNMPRMNGIEFLRELRSDASLKQSVVFVLTTSEHEQDKTAAYNEHVTGYIVKSNIGNDFMEVTALLDAYWKIVELP
ncbi:MAG: putative response regulator receiver protein [Myxococcaceae bacterium]|nr:putative response regulator receiver protein [Myxococcaceae bacterium]